MSARPLYEFDEETRQLLIKTHLGMHGPGSKVSHGSGGKFGDVYVIELNNGSGLAPAQLVAAKCPRIRPFESAKDARLVIEKLLNEIDNTDCLRTIPWVNRFQDVVLIHGWPFVLSRYHSGTLQDLIGNPLEWSVSDRLACLVQIARSLRLAAEHGIDAHQDLKPANIFFRDLNGQYPDIKGYTQVRYVMKVGDFGLANAFRTYGTNSGSRPYQAPEQYSSVKLELNSPVKFDVFALGVLTFECLTDGIHPIGVVTSDIWPNPPDNQKKYKHEDIWWKWANQKVKKLPTTDRGLSKEVEELILKTLSPDSKLRPTILEYETEISDELFRTDPEMHKALMVLVKDLEERYKAQGEWPYLDDRIKRLRKFYAEL